MTIEFGADCVRCGAKMEWIASKPIHKCSSCGGALTWTTLKARRPKDET